MQINRTDSSASLARLADSAQPEGRTANPQQRGGGDAVQLSSLARQLAEVEPSKLGRLQAAVDAGTYKVAPGDIARSLISNAFA